MSSSPDSQTLGQISQLERDNQSLEQVAARAAASRSPVQAASPQRGVGPQGAADEISNAVTPLFSSS